MDDRNLTEREEQPSAAVTPAAPAPVVAPRAGGAGLAWLALILVLALAAVGVWALLEAQAREALLRERLQGLEAVSGRDVSALDGIRSSLERQVALEVKAAENALRGQWQETAASLREGERAAAAQLERLERSQAELGDDVERLTVELQRQSQRLDGFGSDEREAWRLSEAHYLLRLARQRLRVTADVTTAASLLRAADESLAALDVTEVGSVREALAADLSALQAVTMPDAEGLHARLRALVQRSDSLRVHEVPGPREEETPAAAPAPPAPAEGWRERLRRSYEQALERLSSYVVLRRREASPPVTLMDPQWEGLLRQSLRLLLQQAEIALLTRDTALFRSSLQRARDSLEYFQATAPAQLQAMTTEMESLLREPVGADLPDLSRSLEALERARASRRAAASGGGP